MRAALSQVLLAQPQIRNLWQGGDAGLWADPSDATVQSQTSNGALGNTVIDGPVGYVGDKSGRGNNILQATADARPTLKLEGTVYSWLFDGTNDALATASFSAGTFTNSMDCFVALKRNTAAKFVLAYAGGNFFGTTESGSSGNTVGGLGTPTYAVNGVDVPGGTAVTSGQMHTAMPVGEWLVLECRNLNMSAWTSFAIGAFGGGYNLVGSLGGIVLCPTVDSQRTRIRKFMGRKIGLSL